jgi:hypothetical protein
MYAFILFFLITFQAAFSFAVNLSPAEEQEELVAMEIGINVLIAILPTSELILASMPNSAARRPEIEKSERGIVELSQQYLIKAETMGFTPEGKRVYLAKLRQFTEALQTMLNRVKTLP